MQIEYIHYKHAFDHIWTDYYVSFSSLNVHESNILKGAHIYP